jgi:hypothetical protein
MPNRLGDCGLGQCRRVILRRRFGRPRRLDEHERVWLVGERIVGRAEFCVNGEPVGTCSDEPFALPVTHLIADRNELSIELVSNGPNDGMLGDVALEIRCCAFLEAVRGERLADGQFRVNGQVSGEADRPLDLYVLAAGTTHAYQKCRAGERFDIRFAAGAEASADLRIELIAGATTWYAIEFTVQ